MLLGLKKAVFTGFCISLMIGGTITNLSAQEKFRPVLTKFTSSLDPPDLPQLRPVDPTSLLLLMGAQIRDTELDCSHFVQYLYEQAGLYYGYAPSRTLYDGMEGFRRVSHPEAGDLIVWRGHVGIVVDPEEATFLSALRSGVKTASYESHYWKRRGRPRFFRYVGNHDNVSPEWTARKTLARAGASGE
jgi:cell wall-associated NlpC family hydrolase